MTEKQAAERPVHVTERTAYLQLPRQILPFWYLDRNDIVLMDSGLDIYRDRLFRFLDENRLRPRAVLTSHAHEDHMGNHKALRERYGTEVYITAMGASITASITGIRTFMSNLGWHSIDRYTSCMLGKWEHQILEGETEVRVLGDSFTIFPLRGHAPDQIGFVTPDGVRYLADALMTEDEIRKVRFPFFLDWDESVREKKRLMALPKAKNLVAHNGMTEDLPALCRVNLDFYRKCLQEVLDHMKPGDSLPDIVYSLYQGFERKRSPYELAILEHTVHLMLDYMMDLGLVSVGQRHGAGAICYNPEGRKVPPLV